jgi:hypothetical protein
LGKKITQRVKNKFIKKRNNNLAREVGWPKFSCIVENKEVLREGKKGYRKTQRGQKY